MKLLLDTCTFIWMASYPRHIPQAIRDLYSAADNAVYLSAASAWEIAIKHQTGKLQLPNKMLPIDYVKEARRRHRIESLAVDEESSAVLSKMPDIHRDPFDRMLICQAIANQMMILTPDPLITQYPVMTRW
ncbi:MAG: type II toxin-antitoxin system VapC family toxin [Rhodocyclaceae bacterium]|nr:type II toxin-antitoxin system VapC family toxin [Rhodocyclaceae bacterium]MDZ4214210.1 type II toxin-antitoxin system VapC family toxin [Rhodocyclaceae bacterium]